MADALVMHDPVAAFGLITGGVGLCMAVFLALVTPRRVPYRYTMGFFTVGAFLVMSHTDPFVEANIATSLRLVALLGVLVIEGSAFKWVLSRSRERVSDDGGHVSLVDEYFH